MSTTATGSTAPTPETHKNSDRKGSHKSASRKAKRDAQTDDSTSNPAPKSSGSTKSNNRDRLPSHITISSDSSHDDNDSISEDHGRSTTSEQIHIVKSGVRRTTGELKPITIKPTKSRKYIFDPLRKKW
jgi:hypothetical protein